MKLARRKFLHLTAGAVALPAVSRVGNAQGYPTRPITMIVPFAAGSSTDVVGRILSERMRAALRQPIIVENVTGADGNIGVGRVARARSDGYTIGMGTIATNVLNGAFYSLSYDLLGDFTPIAPVYVTPYVLYGKASLPAKDLNELIAWLRANPNKALAGVISAGLRMVTAFFQKATGTRFALVPYRGLPPANAGPCCGTNRSFLLYCRSSPAGARREYQSIRCDERCAPAAGTGESNGRRDGIALGFLLRLGSTVRAQKRPEGHYRHAQCSRRGGAGRSGRCVRGWPISGLRSIRTSGRRRKHSAPW
jgi:hypothetical protein